MSLFLSDILSTSLFLRKPLFLWAVLFGSIAPCGYAASPERVEELTSLIRPLQELRERIQTLEFVKILRIENEIKGKVSEVSEESVLIHYSHEENKVRQQVLKWETHAQENGLFTSTQTGAGGEVRFKEQSIPEPNWLFKLPELLQGWETTIYDEKDNIVVEGRVPQQQWPTPFAKVTFSSGKLPIEFVTYDIKGNILDEFKIDWSNVQDEWFPSEVRLVQYSRQNVVTMRALYQQVKVNQRISSILFDEQ